MKGERGLIRSQRPVRKKKGSVWLSTYLRGNGSIYGQKYERNPRQPQPPAKDTEISRPRDQGKQDREEHCSEEECKTQPSKQVLYRLSRVEREAATGKRHLTEEAGGVMRFKKISPASRVRETCSLQTIEEGLSGEGPLIGKREASIKVRALGAIIREIIR